MADHSYPADQRPSSAASWPPQIDGLSDLSEVEPICGGQAQIYRVTQGSMERPVACKILHRRYLDEELRLTAGSTRSETRPSTSRLRRFMDEAAITSSLQPSGYVPPVITQGDAAIVCVDGEGRSWTEPWPYIVLEWIVGPNLDELVRGQDRLQGLPYARRDSKTQAKLLRVFDQLARGVAAAHSHPCRWVHRDLKPGNILLGNGERVKIIDWGIARPDGAENDFAGTAAYMAPEQKKGGATQVSFAFDIYALGGIGYFLLTGRHPRNGSDEELAARANDEGHHARLRKDLASSGAPEFWIQLVGSCLQIGKRPSAQDLVDAIDRYPAEQEEAKWKAREAEHQAKAAREQADRRSERLKWRSVIVALLLVLGLGSLLAWSHIRQVTTERDAKATITEALGREKEALAGKNEALGREKRALARESETNKRNSDRTWWQQRLTAIEVRWERAKTEGDKARIMREYLAETKGLADFAAQAPDDALSQYLLGAAWHVAGDMCGIIAERPGAAAAARKLREEGLAHYDRAEALLSPLIGGPLNRHFPNLPKSVANVFVGRTKTLHFLARYTEALVAFDEAVRLGARPEAIFPGNVPRRALLLPAAREQTKLPWSRPPRIDHDKATRMADYLLAALERAADEERLAPKQKAPPGKRDKGGGVLDALLERVSWPSLRDKHTYNAACAHALAAGDAGAAEETRDRRGRQAVTYLNRLARSGYFRNEDNVRELKADPDLAPLKGRKDYLSLVKEVGGERPDAER